MHARFERLILLVGLLALLVPLGCSSEPGDGGGGGGQCVIEQPGEPSPGYPFNLGAFKDQIIPALNADCEQCHGVNGPNHDSFVIFAATAQPGNCDYVNTFKEVKAKSDLVTPDNSPIVRAMQGQVTDHPIYDQPKIDVFLTYIRDANATCVANGQCQPSNGIGFDKPTFETVIQPALDRAVGLAGTGCAAALGCHGPPAGTSNFILNANPAPGSAEMDANFTEITSKKVNLTTPENSIFYTKAIAAHGVGQSSVVSAADGAAILAWIKAAQGSAPPPATGCADKTLLNEGVWETEVLTMLKGDLDWNNAGSGQPQTRCAGATCHGNPALPFNLTGTPAESLERFACFVNLDSPSRSPVVVCPATGGGVDCPVSVHPGGRVFVDANDANLRKLLSFLFAAVAGKSPLDFGFYSTKLDPFFNDPNACAEVDLDCADSECHGVQFNGQLPANGSQLPMLQNAGDVNRLKINFASVSNFVNFGDGPTSSLHLYPTDECRVDLLNCTGTAHGGGVCFNDGDAIDLDIIKWADGLQPNANSTMTDWLVTGDFADADEDDDPLNVENNTSFLPSIFDRSFGSLLGGQFVGLYSPVDKVDVGATLGGAAGVGRFAYAVAYLLNASNRDIQLNLTIDTINKADIYFDGRLTGFSAPGGGLATGFTVVQPYSRTKKLTQVVIKLHQDANDAELAFTATAADDDVPLINDKRLFVLTGGAAGGI